MLAFFIINITVPCPCTVTIVVQLSGNLFIHDCLCILPLGCEYKIESPTHLQQVFLHFLRNPKFDIFLKDSIEKDDCFQRIGLHDPANERRDLGVSLCQLVLGNSSSQTCFPDDCKRSSLRGVRPFIFVVDNFTEDASRLLTSTVLLLMDSLYFGKLTFTPLNFLRANLSSLSLFYGANPWHYYITQAIPILLTTALPFTLHGIWVSMRSQSTRENNSLKVMLVTVVWTVVVYSFAGHKEWRFLHPILPLLHIFAAKSLVDLASNQKSRSKAQPQVLTFIHRYFKLPNIPRRHLTLLLATLPVSAYIVLFYCSAPISVLSFLRAIPRTELNSTTIGMLMPCHSTPGQAFLHREELADGRMWALGCEPPLE